MIFFKNIKKKLVTFKKNIFSFYRFIINALAFFYEKKVFSKIKFTLRFFYKYKKKYIHSQQLKEHVLIKYLIKELILYFSVAFLFFFMIFFVNQILLLAEKILKQRVPFSDVARLIAYTLPFVIAQSAPFATLVGFLMCLGRMMSDNEVLIIRASGHGYKIIMIPVLILGFGISVFSFFVNDYLLPVGTINYNKLYRQIIASNPTVQIEPNSIKRLNNATIVIGDVKDNSVSDLIFFDMGKEDEQRIIVAGDSNIGSAKKEGVLMQLNMSNTAAVFLDEENRMDFDILSSNTATLNIFDSSIFNTSSSTSPREMTSYDLGRTIRDMKKSGDYTERKLNLYTMEYNKKFSLPFGSVFFALLALPLAFLFGKHNGQTIGLIVGLVICVVYWAMMILGQIFSSRIGINGFWAMWFPDLLMGFAGILFYAVLKRK